MSAFEQEILSPCGNKIKLLKWKVRKGSVVYRGSVLALYSIVDDDENAQVCKLKADKNGTVGQLAVDEGDIVNPKGLMLRVHEGQSDQLCSHPTIMKDMCANCGADLRQENGLSGERKKDVSASVAMVHSIPELIISQEQALELGKQDENRLLSQNKLVLLVDLDQTLIHTTNDQIPSNLKDVKHFQLWDGRGYIWYHTHFRPYTEKFLEAISKMYELHICTFGVRVYAHTIARLLDPDEKYFSHRILSRDECFDNLSKTANLKALFPCGDKMVGIIDDREDVWNFAPNLIHVKPYRFFQGTADINAPPGLTKSELDNVPIVHKTVSHKEELSDNKHSEDTSVAADKADEKSVSITKDDINVQKKMMLESDGTEKKVEGSDEKVVTDGNHADNSIEPSDKYCGEKDENNLNPVSSDVLDMNTEMKLTSKNEEVNYTDNPTDDSTVLETGKSASDEQERTKIEVSEIIDKDENMKTKDEIEWEDSDDYLLHLEEILTRIHKAFYNIYEQSMKGGSSEMPDLKNIIPYVKKKVLKGANIVFSGMFPVNMSPERSKAYITAKSLGANVQTDIVPNKSKKSSSSNATTHLVAAKAGTIKYKSAMKAKGVCIVTGDWLWACAERWEWVPEELFLLPSLKENKDDSLSEHNEGRKAKNIGKRKKVKMSQGNSDLIRYDNDVDDSTVRNDDSPAKKSKNDEESKFASSYNPLLSFSNEDIEFMDKEVDEMLAEGENDSDESDQERNDRLRKQVLGNSTDSDSDSDSLAGDFPRGWKMRRKSLSPQYKNPLYEEGVKTDEEMNDDETENELERYDKTVEAFAPQESDQDSDASGDSIGSVDEEIAAAVEKEFLGSL